MPDNNKKPLSLRLQSEMIEILDAQCSVTGESFGEALRDRLISGILATQEKINKVLVGKNLLSKNEKRDQ